MKTLFLLLLILCGSAQAQWTSEQKTLAAVASVALVIDYGQTKSIATKDIYREGVLMRNVEHNPMLPRHPDMRDVNRHFILTPIIAYAVLDNISSENRTMALKVLTAVQIGIVAHNYSIGIRAEF
jgi:hypothetical protein